MKLLSVTVLLNILTFYCVCANEGDVAPEPVSTTNTPEPTSSTTPSNTSSTTSATTPTTSTTTTVTTPTTSKVTTSATTPTTSSITTPTTSSTSTTTSTTAAPSTTTPTTEKPTSTVTPPPGPKPGTWEVKNSTNSSCILLKMVGELEVHFNDTNKTSQLAKVPIPLNATAVGSCGSATNENQSIKLQWSFVKDMNNSMEFIFSKKDKKFELDVINVDLTLDPNNFKNASDKKLDLVHKQVDFVTPIEMSYKCEKEQSLNLYIANSTNSTGVLKISEFQLQAYGNIANKQFADAKDCEPYETPDIVPIAVGCALMALIIIVLVGYLIGRRRNQARGYLSMIEE
ncbi:hypothetical protein Trydic_g22506 [Trypoxylus dichotomus]